MNNRTVDEEHINRTTDEEHALSADMYFGPNYFAWDQLVSLSQQLIEVHNSGGKEVLEIGKGNGFVSDFLRKAGMNVTTFDINPNLNPDVVGDVLELERHFSENSFDTVLCAEVLEHMPFENFRPTLKQIAKVCRSSCVLTLPRLQRILIDWQMRIKIPKMEYKTMGLFLAAGAPLKNMYAGHHWEICSSKETEIGELRAIIREHFEIEEDYRLRWKAYHQFFVLKALNSKSED